MRVAAIDVGRLRALGEVPDAELSFGVGAPHPHLPRVLERGAMKRSGGQRRKTLAQDGAQQHWHVPQIFAVRPCKGFLLLV